jgi:transposase
VKLPRSRLTHAQTERLLEHFVAGTPARPAAELVGVNRHTARLFYHRLRECIARRLARRTPAPPEPSGEREPLAGLYADNGRVGAVVLVAGEAPRALDAVIVAAPGRRVLHARDLRCERTPRSSARLDPIGNFWSLARRLLRRYNGVPRAHLHLFLAECEWRFNFGPPRSLRRVLRQWLARG